VKARVEAAPPGVVAQTGRARDVSALDGSVLVLLGRYALGAHLLVLAGATLVHAAAVFSGPGGGAAARDLVELLGSTWTGPVYVALGFLAATAGWIGAVGEFRGAKSTLGLLAIGAVSVVVGRATGWTLASDVAGVVPWLIPLLWFTMVYAALSLALRMGFGALGSVAGTVAGLLAWSLPVAASMERGAPFGPVDTVGAGVGPTVAAWGAWALTGIVMAGAACHVGRPWREGLERQDAPLALYLAGGALPLAFALKLGHPGAGAIGATAMGAFVWVAMGPWPDRFVDWWDRTQSNPVFHRWAGAIPLTRPVAVRRAQRVFDLCSGFVFSQTMLACFRLGLFDELARGPRHADDLARLWKMSPDAVRRLLDAAEVLDLVRRRRGGRYGLGALGAPLVGNEAVAAMAEHNLLLYRDLEDPVALLRASGGGGTAVGRYWPYAWRDDPRDLTADEVTHYSALMTRSHGLVADEVLARYPFGRHRRFLDVGAGEAAFAQRVAERHPGLEVTAFDLPGVAERAAVRLAEESPGVSVRLVGGDFFRDTLPGGMDVVTLLRVIHDHDDDDVAELLARVREALEPGGHLVVGEPMAGTAGSERVGSAYFSWYLHAMGAGRPRTPLELEALLRTAGFRRIRIHTSRVPVQTGLLTALR
jgi:demethylspheroidene O-methyltransferase